MQRKSEAGIGHLLLLLVVLVVVAVVGLVGWRVKQNQGNKAEPITSTQPVAGVTSGVPDKISSTADLNTVQNSLNQTNLDSDLNPNSLDADVNSLL